MQDEKFSPRSSDARVAELEGLQGMLEAGVARVDDSARQLSAPAERLRKLLTATDKKAALLAMAADNELDQAFLNLLDQNILGAQAAGQTDAATFMVKIRDAAMRYKTPAV